MSAASKRIYAITLRKAHSYMTARGFTAADLLEKTELFKSSAECFDFSEIFAIAKFESRKSI